YVDKVGIFHVTGGEPTLYPQLSEFLLYIINNYRDKIIDLVMPTNAIREIPDEMIKIFKLGNMLIEIDNYLNVVPQYKNIFDKNFNKLKEYGVRIYGSIDKVSPPFFISSYPPNYDYSLLSDEENSKRFDYCGSVFSEIRDKKIYACCYHGFAETAGIIEQDDDAVFNLDENLNKKEFIEFRMKYNNRGFTKFCTKCNGLPPLNIKALPTGEQTNGIISWDGSYKESQYITVDEMLNKK
ncbi:radical SAM protein, partial [Brachyspira murdochii]